MRGRRIETSDRLLGASDPSVKAHCSVKKRSARKNAKWYAASRRTDKATARARSHIARARAAHANRPWKLPNSRGNIARSPDATAHSMSYSEILYDVDDGILTITLNRPEKLNAFTVTMMTEMIDALDRSDADDSIRAVIVTGAGRAFC